MKNQLAASTDIRQSEPWAKYMAKIGWRVERVDESFIYIKRIKFFNRSIIKIPHAKNIDIKKLEQKVKKYKPVFIIVEPHTQDFNEKEFIKNKYKKSKLHFAPTATIKIDLTKTEKEIFLSLSENARRNIRKAEKNKLQVKIVESKKDNDLKWFSAYHELVKTLTKKKGFYAPGYAEAIKKNDAFKDDSVFFFAYEDNVPIAVVWFGIFDRTITYMQTGIQENGYKLLANYLLVWEGIRWAKKKGIKVFDFESIYDERNPHENKRWIGFSEFKKRFHGVEIYYPPTQIKYYSQFFRLLEVFTR